MKTTPLHPLPNSKTINASCQSCHRLTQIEGEMVCFHNGQIIRLIPMPETEQKLNLLCEGWQGSKLKSWF